MGLLTYSGIATKIRAMESRLLTPGQLQEMASLEDVRSAADYLKQQPSYRVIFSGLDDTRLHRGYIEHLLEHSEYQDFARLYRFSNLSQRRFLDLYFMRYEITIIKRVLRNVMGGKCQQLELSDFQSFFDQHSSINLMKLLQARNMQEFVAGLEGSPYYELMTNLKEGASLGLSDYEFHIDLYYFKTMWKTKDKLLTGREREIITNCFGSNLDLLNIQWIYRSKKYYQLSPYQISQLLIPIKYKLKAEQIKRMTEAASPEDFFRVLKTTHYGKLPETEWSGKPDVEMLYQQILKRIYSSAGRRHPYTIAVLDSYFYAKEQEIKKIITTIEGIRYGLPPEEITAMAEKQ